MFSRAPAGGGVGDQQIVSPPSDTVQALQFSPVPQSPTSILLLAGAWDATARLWEVNHQGQSNAMLQTAVDAPLLDVAFHQDGSAGFLASADNTVKMWDFRSQEVTTVGQHDAPVKSCHWIDHLNVLMTGSWDKTLRFWDLRSPQPAGQFPLSERVYSADVRENLGCVGTADNKVHIFDLSSGPQTSQVVDTTLKMQTRCVRCFPKKDGFATGSIEGRCAIVYIDPMRKKDTFSFKCHRSNRKIHSVNSVSFHPQYHTFVTAGSDGNIHFWDKDMKQRTESLPTTPNNTPIVCTDFSGDGKLLAYGIGYDWSQGHAKAQGATNTIMIHVNKEKEVKPARRK